ncbi:ArsR/SmtB family transcription factor [Streptomyces clavuligerus]|nr:winged helix-turn-helix domain-containing protein [Streptomyces clavuligerus]ANW21614.1 transcriptional regulator [Streptomyces clavuligerus]AXU16240.1 ArsR family transcriptional regulator [Streptomyces clavuligerus]MBY6306398.1 winged helix-turn-helix transcriptional regulator [Streptomyces clavuligerus]QCS09020.1 ArsR family transcriptional regulator [Streptomyces clavuligerus]QPJ91644.1 ArsR family transcriptional regulator [Streptomyces clavuligerus]
MLRIHFSTADLGRIHLAPGPDPAWEALLSLHVLGSCDEDPVMRPWRRRMRDTVDPMARPLLGLAPPRGYSPDFLTPAQGVDGIESGIEMILTTPRARLRAELAVLGRQRRLPPGVGALADGRPEALRGLGGALRRYHRQALTPYWPQIRASVEADREQRARAFLAGGTERLLGSLHPTIRWEPPVLLVAYPVDSELRLEGRGLRLVPSFFCRGTPIALRDTTLPPVLVYPVARAIGALDPAPAAGGDRLARLLGRTRAATLYTIADAEHTTGNEIARRLAISPASASEHATVLRDAGLIQSLRVRNTTRHTLTRLGMELLEGRSPVVVPGAVPGAVPRVPAARQDAGCP